VEAAETAPEGAEITGQSEDEEEPPVTESGSDALNMEEERPPAEAESAPDEGSALEEDETSG